MAVSKDLFELIKTMKDSEKKFFKNDTFKPRTTSHYLKMFTLIEKQNIYDENILLKKMQKLKDFSSLSSSKNYLYKLIMNSLIKRREKNKVKFIIRKKINEIEILAEKGLKKRCLSKMKKAIEYCQKYDLVEQEMSLQKIELSILSRVLKSEQLDLSNYEHCIDKHFNYLEFQKKAAIIQTYINDLGFFTENNKKKEAFQRLKNFIENEPLFLKEKNALSYSSKILYNNFNSILAELNNDTEKSLEFSKKQIELTEQNMDIALFFPNTIVSTYTNYISLCSSLKMFENMMMYINKLDNYINKYKEFNELNVRAGVFDCKSNYEIIYYLNSLDFDKCLKLIIEYDKEFETIKKYLRNANKHYYHSIVSTVFFYMGNNLKSLDYTQKLLFAQKEEINDSLLISAYMLCIIIYFEEGMFSLMNSNIRALKRILMKIDRKGKEDDLLFKFLNLLQKTPKNEYQDVFNLLYKEMLDITVQGGSFTMYYFDIISWVEAKAKNKKLIKIISSKPINYV